MENRERYKRLIMFLASAVIIAIETLLFAYIWYKFYAHKEVIGRRFDRGNQVVIGLYVLMIYFFYKIYGGFKVGYLRVFEVIYSQILCVLREFYYLFTAVPDRPLASGRASDTYAGYDGD